MMGVDQTLIKVCAGTGLVVDLIGTAPADEVIQEDCCKLIALRADMDGLPMPENAKDLPYKTTTDYAHMCGHDGHMACLIACAAVVQSNLSKIPSNRGVRLLFQPAEECIGGAEPMIAEKCLEGVDEVYGFHNIPNFDEGDIRVCEGPFFAAVTVVKIKVVGQGGHGSTPHKLTDPITCAN